MADVDELLQPVTEETLWGRLTAAYDAAKVAWRSWSTRSPFLVDGKFATREAFSLREAVREVFRGLFLQFARGVALTYFSRSQFELERQPSVFAVGRVIIDLSASVSAVSISAGQLRGGTPGPITSASRLFTSTSVVTLQPGERTIVEFQADEAGDLHNLAVGSPFELKTTIVGATATVNASGEPQRIGTGNASLILYAAQAGVTVRCVDPGVANYSLTVSGNLVSKLVTVTLGTNGAGALSSTAAQVRKGIADAINIGATAVGPFVLSAALGGDGTGIVQPTVTPVALPWLGQWLSQYGSPEEDDDRLIDRCLNRWDTLGGGSGDGVPVSDAQTDSALAYWALAKPANRAASPVKRCRVYSNMDSAGNVDGASALVLLAGPAGALSAGDVADVLPNFENPPKYSFGTTLRVMSVTNETINVIGVVWVKKNSGRTLAEVSAAVAASFAKYNNENDLIGIRVEPTVLTGICWSADPAAIARIELTSPTTYQQLAFDRYAVFNIAPLVVAFVP